MSVAHFLEPENRTFALKTGIVFCSNFPMHTDSTTTSTYDLVFDWIGDGDTYVSLLFLNTLILENLLAALWSAVFLHPRSHAPVLF